MAEGRRRSSSWRWVAVGAVLVLGSVGVSFAFLGGDSPAVPTISADESWSHVGQDVTVRFVVQSTTLQGNQELLNAEQSESAPYGFSAILSDAITRTARYDPATYDFGHTIFVNGTVRIAQRRPVIVVTTLEQIGAPNPAPR